MIVDSDRRRTAGGIVLVAYIKASFLLGASVLRQHVFPARKDPF
jgi:hypothetical protein